MICPPATSSIRISPSSTSGWPTHYGIPGVTGIAMRRVALPPDSLRGGFMTQASVLKVTANGTTTSPVLRGKWITERIMGLDIPPPPPTSPPSNPTSAAP